jgi:hypothetical protein
MTESGKEGFMSISLNGRARVYAAAKWAVAVLAVVLIAVHSAGTKMSSTSFDDMKEAVMAAADTTNMLEADSQMIRRLYGIDPDEYDGVLLWYPKTNMKSEELLVVKLRDGGQMKALEQAISARKDTLLQSFRGYGAEQTAMLENSVTDLRGNYAFFCSADDPDRVHQAFLTAY